MYRFYHISYFFIVSFNSKGTLFQSTGPTVGHRTMNQLGRSCSRWLKFGLWLILFSLLGGGKYKKSFMRDEVHPIFLDWFCHVAKHLYAVYVISIKETFWRHCSGKFVINGSRNTHKVKTTFIPGNLVPIIRIIFHQNIYCIIPNQTVRWCWSSEGNPKHFNFEFEKV